jgi:hypothetical protein
MLVTGERHLRLLQHVHALEQDGIDMQEVAGQDAVCLGCQELQPCRRRPPRSGAEPNGSCLHEEFSQVIQGVGVWPLTLCAAGRGLRVGGWGGVGA